MADTHISAALTSQGFYGDLAQLGLPLPLVVCLELKKLTLESAMWNARCSATAFSVTLFWPALGSHSENKKRKRTRRRKTATQAKVGKEEGNVVNTMQKLKDDAGSNAVPAEVVNTPINTPPVLVPHLPPDTPSVSKNKDPPTESDDDPAILDRIVQCGPNVYDKVEFVMEETIGPALKFADKGGGVALTPIRMHTLDGEDEEMDDETVRKYLKACKSVEYVRVDGQPGLTLHRGRCRFWTTVEVTPEVVRTKPD